MKKNLKSQKSNEDFFIKCKKGKKSTSMKKFSDPKMSNKTKSNKKLEELYSKVTKVNIKVRIKW